MTTENQEQDQLQQYPDSVLERGFGVVGKIVMQDIRISVTAKAIYAYICTFGNVSYPGRDKIYSGTLVKTKIDKFLNVSGSRHCSIEQQCREVALCWRDVPDG